MRNSLLFLIFALFTIGCQPKGEQKSLQNQQPSPSLINIESNHQITNSEIADHLSQIARNVPNVNHANAIVAGPYAVVGIDVDGDLDRSRVGTIKYSVSEALQHDPYGKTAIVIADADLTERFQAMNKKMREGEPIQGIIDELAAIVGRYMPTLPLPEEQKEEFNEREMPEDQEQNLEEIQEEQSNNNL